MTLKQRAALQTAAILAAIVGVSVGVQLILENFTAQQIGTGFAVASVIFLIYSMYGVILSRLEYQDTLNKMVDKSAK